MGLSDVDRLAHRLREMQGGFSDETPEERQAALEMLLREGVQRLVPEERERFLAELSRRFPTWDADQRDVLEREAPAQANPREHDWTWHVERLREIARGLSEGERRAMGTALGDLLGAGSTRASGPVGWPEAAAQRVRDLLFAGEPNPIDSARALEVLAMLSDMAMRLDKIVRAVWVSLLPEDRLRQPPALDKQLGKHLVGEPETGTMTLDQQLKDLRQRAQLMIGLLADAGRIAYGRVEFLLPAEVERSAEKATFTRSTEHQCWVAYKKRASLLDRESFQQEVRRDLGEELRKVVGAGGSAGA